jgi:PAS domain S-box-containing protein
MRRLPGAGGDIRATDLLALACTLAFASWLLFGWGERVATLVSLVLFGTIGILTVVAQVHVSRLAEHPRERLAWGLLAASALARLISGTVWGLIQEYGVYANNSPWLIALASSYLLFGIAGLLAFPSGRWQAADWRRIGLDAATVLIGSLLVVWYFAIGPFLRSPTSASADVGAQIYTIGDSVTVVLVAALYLRSASAATRTAALFLLIAVTLQVIPDIGFWQQGWASTYSAGDPIAGIWYGVWLAKWLAARLAEHVLRRPRAAPFDDAGRYRSGPIPHAFLGAAVVLLLVTLTTGETEDRGLYTLGSALLALLLVARQAMELRERDRLHRTLKAEEARYRALVQHAFDAVLLLDASGQVRYASPNTAHIMGALAAEIEGQPGWSVLSRVHPDDLTALRGAFEAPEAGPRSLTLRVRDKDGQWRVLEATVQDLRGDRHIGGWVVNALDRTREQRLAEDLRGTAQLEALGVLASGLAHDLNNILAVIASHVELLADEQGLSADARVDVEAIRLASNKAQALTQGLLTLSRRKGTSWAVIDVDPLVRERVARLWGPAVTGELSSASAVRADPAALARVIDVVLEESVLATPHATRTVRTRQHDVDAALASELHVEPGRFVVVDVGAPGDSEAGRVEPAVSTADEWNLAPTDLAMLMALASAREVGGTIVRECAGSSERLAVYLPAAVA